MIDSVDVPNLLTPKEAAALLNVSEDTLRRERLSGRLGDTRIRSKVFFTPEQLSAYIRSCAVFAPQGGAE
jgi:excisionase family DNA binding protein